MVLETHDPLAKVQSEQIMKTNVYEIYLGNTYLLKAGGGGGGGG